MARCSFIKKNGERCKLKTRREVCHIHIKKCAEKSKSDNKKKGENDNFENKKKENICTDKNKECSKKKSEKGNFENKKEENICIVCTENLNNNDKPCCKNKHIIHKECIIKSGKKECPLCRGKILSKFLSPKENIELKTIGKKYKQEFL